MSIIQTEIYRFLDHPETPTEFSHIIESLTDTSVTLQWKAGFNGGVPQVFVLTYRKEDVQDWEEMTLQDSGDSVMNVTIHGLSSNTNYQIQLYAVNSEGISGNVTLQIKTKGNDY